jgi:hypothetical protein
MIYDAALVARSLAGDHSWVPAFLKSVSVPKADSSAAPDRPGT